MLQVLNPTVVFKSEHIMTHRILFEPGFILHRRSYSNTSLIVEIFSFQYGRVAAVARSARGLNSRYKGALQLFSPMLLSWSGLGELKTLGQIELNGKPCQLDGRSLLCGFYLNELLLRLLHRDDPYPNLFRRYAETLEALEKNVQLSVTLRCFEKQLLYELGYGPPLAREARTGVPIAFDLYYQYVPECGFIRCENFVDFSATFLGSSIIALNQEKFDTEQSLKDARRLLRMILAQYLGNRPLKSRELMR